MGLLPSTYFRLSSPCWYLHSFPFLWQLWQCGEAPSHYVVDGVSVSGKNKTKQKWESKSKRKKKKKKKIKDRNKKDDIPWFYSRDKEHKRWWHVCGRPSWASRSRAALYRRIGNRRRQGENGLTAMRAFIWECAGCGSRSRLLLLSGYERGDGETSINRHLGLIGWLQTCHASSREAREDWERWAIELIWLKREIRWKEEEEEGEREREQKARKKKEKKLDISIYIYTYIYSKSNAHLGKRS